MDLNRAQIGDRVKSVLKGWGTIADKTRDCVWVVFDCIGTTSSNYLYNVEGKSDTRDIYPEIVELVRPVIDIEGGGYCLSGDGHINESSMDYRNIYRVDIRERGRDFKNTEQAQAADEIITPIQRLLRFAMMYDPDFYEDGLYQNNMQENVAIIWDEIYGEYCMCPYCRAGMTTIPMTEKTARELVDELNAGRIKL